jgi:hypothetical protein
LSLERVIEKNSAMYVSLCMVYLTMLSVARTTGLCRAEWSGGNEKEAAGVYLKVISCNSLGRRYLFWESYDTHKYTLWAQCTFSC